MREQDDEYRCREQRAATRRWHVRVRRCTPATTTPASMNASAVSRTILGQPGTMLVSCSMSSVQPASTNSAHGQRHERREPREDSARFRALGDPHDEANYSNACECRNLVRLSLEVP